MSQQGPEYHQPQQPSGSPQMPYGQQESYGNPHPYGQPLPYGQPGGMQPAADASDRTIAMLSHLAAPIAMLLSAGSLPFLGPLVVWLIYKDKSPFVRQAAAGAFNFNLTATVMSVIGWLCILTLIGAVIGIPLIILAVILSLVFSIKGAMNASSGLAYNYPMQIRVLT